MKSSMSGQNIPLVHRLFSLWKIFRAYQTGIFGNAEEEIEFHYQLIRIFEENSNIKVEKARMLDIGCGRTAVQTALFSADGADITGIDMEVPTYSMDLSSFIQVIKTNGSERAVKSLIRHLLYDRHFFSDLTLKYDKPVFFQGLDVRTMDATKMSFPEDCFDFIFSAWSFEHIDNVDKALSEVNRVLKTSGIASIAIHLFPSLSGGHHMDWIFPDKSSSDTVPAWDHCLENKYPVNTYLNKLRLRDYREIFQDNVDVLNEEIAYEGEKYLSPELEEKLYEKGYTREDLVARTVTFLCRKKHKVI